MLHFLPTMAQYTSKSTFKRLSHIQQVSAGYQSYHFIIGVRPDKQTLPSSPYEELLHTVIPLYFDIDGIF